MPLPVTCEHAAITGLVTCAVAADPVRATLLATIASSLGGTAWAAGTAERFAVRSAAYWPVALWGDWSAAQRADLVSALRHLDNLRGVSGVMDVVDPVVAALHDPRPAHRMAQGLFRLDDLSRPRGVAGSARLATVDDRALLREWIAAFMVEAHDIPAAAQEVADRAIEQGCWLWLDETGAPVSLAARRAVVGGSARIGPVYTPPTRRGHGYGSAVTAAASDAVLRDGGIPVLFTDLANPTSNKIYQLLGYRRVEDRVVVTFD
jgi:predicted GNAT family acetyltransferase